MNIINVLILKNIILYTEYYKINKHTYKVELIENITIKKLKEVLFIANQKSKYDNFYIDDNLKLKNFENKYNSKHYDLIHIINTLDDYNINTICKTYNHFNKNVFALI